MLLSIVVCVSTMLGSDPGIQPLPIKTPLAAVATQPSQPSDTKHSQPQPDGAAAVKKSDPQPHVDYRPLTDSLKTDSKPQPKTEAKLELIAIEQNILDCTNAERARYGLPAYVVDANLMATARQHCAWMATYRQLVHANIGVAENIAMGQPSGPEVLRAWMNSSGHRANILNGGHRRIGVAAYRTAEGTIYWCQQFSP